MTHRLVLWLLRSRELLREQGNFKDGLVDVFLLALGDVAKLRGDLWYCFGWNSKCRKHQGVQQLRREAGSQVC